MSLSKMNKLMLIHLVIQPSTYDGTYIHMHPDFVFLADVCNSYERIKCPIHCCPSCGTHQKRNKSLQESRGTLCMVRVPQPPHPLAAPAPPVLSPQWPQSVCQRPSLLSVTLVFSTFRCQRHYSFYLKVAANFQTSILHLLGCMRQAQAQQNNSASHHLPETKSLHCKMSHKQTSTRHHSERSDSGGLCPALGCSAIIPVWPWGAPVLPLEHRVWCGPGEVGGSSPIPKAGQGDSSPKVKAAASTEARDSLLNSLC